MATTEKAIVTPGTTGKLVAADYLVLLLLSAIWGASFLFLRIAAPQFGPVLLIELRVLFGLLFLLPVFLLRGKFSHVVDNWRTILVIGLLNMAVPFTLLAFATLSITAGYASILNATVPFFTAIVAFLFFQERIPAVGVLGLIVGFSGVVVLVLDPTSTISPGGNLLAILAGLSASLLYGVAAVFVVRKLPGVSGLAITVTSLFFSALFLLPFALLQLPESLPTGWVWLAVIALGSICTGLAYVLFYRLIARIGSYRTVTVTFLVPAFSMLWGYLLLDETVTLLMLLGCVLVLLGVGM
ncbi:MAG: DMT family transporter, partial [Gammaproteobacteria bacterium]